MFKKLFEKIVTNKMDGYKVHGVAVLGAVSAIAALLGHPLPIGPAMTDAQAWALLWGSGLASAFRDTARKLIHKGQ